MPTVEAGGQQHDVETRPGSGGALEFYVDGQYIGDNLAYKAWLAQQNQAQATSTTVVKSHRNDSEGYPIDENGNRTSDTPSPVLTPPPGSTVVDHRDGAPERYTAGGVDDPNLKIDKAPVYQSPDYSAQQKALQDQIAKTQGTAAPTAAVTPAAQASLAAAPTLAAAQQARAAAAATAGTAKASQAANSDVRAQQLGLAGYFQGQMNGDNSVATVQAKQLANQQLAQQASLAASAAPGNSVAARRIAGQQMAQMGGTLESNALAAQLGERNAAASQLQGLYGTVAGQDIGLNVANAQMGTQTSIANANNQTSTSQFNTGQGNQLSMFNTGQSNDQARALAALQAQIAQSNAGLQTGVNQSNAGLSQQRSLADQAAALQQQGLNNQQIQALLGQQYQYANLGQQAGQFGVTSGQAQQQMQQQQSQFISQQALARQLAELQSQTQLQLGNMNNPGPSWLDYLKGIAGTVGTIAAIA